MKQLGSKIVVPHHLEYLIIDANLIICELSAQVDRFADEPESFQLGEDIHNGLPELFGTEEMLMEVLRGELPSFEMKGIGRFADPDSPLYLDFFANRYYDDKTQEYQLIIFFSDVTDRMVLEQKLVQSTNETSLLLRALAESEEKYRDLFENASDLIQSFGMDGSFIYVNRAWKQTLGYTESEISNLTIFDIIHPDNKFHFLQILARLVRGELVDSLKAEFITKDGKKISVEGSINCKLEDGKAIATRAILRDITERLLTEAALQHEREQTERLLLNILPKKIADKLKQQPSVVAESFAEVTVLFADIVGFTQLASELSPVDLVNLLNKIFSAFDMLTEAYGLEKIKTIGDAYMVVGGLPIRRDDHAIAIAEMAMNMQKVMAELNKTQNRTLSIRIGIHSGPVVAGVIGLKKFIYDLWGDTVNTASRMESHGVPGKIHVSEDTYQLLQHQYLFEKREMIDVKGKGKMITYFLFGPKKNPSFNNSEVTSNVN
ncbi:MAG: PAS domain S-box protein [Arthrospira sp. PLM2.Bin9]|nr:adenylate/guanylate cyclase domain-containing protein [Arthrospira sp. PLM2.Bin9]TVU52262.1 MAG: PAS domain S-box protein [Arthrospira sp. PLM2.Bin9]